MSRSNQQPIEAYLTPEGGDEGEITLLADLTFDAPLDLTRDDFILRSFGDIGL